MILPDRVLGRSGTITTARGREILPSFVADMTADLLAELLGGLVATPQDDVSDDCLAGGRISCTHYRSLSDRRVVHESGLDLGGGDPVTRDVHHIVHTAEHPDVAVLVDLRAVTCEVPTLEARPVGVEVALRVAPDTTQHGRPGTGERQVAASVGDRFTTVVDQFGADAREAARTQTPAWWW